MPGKNKTPLIGWHSADPTLKPWLESHAKHIGVNLRELLDRMAADYRTKHERERLAAARPRTRRAAARPGNVAPAAAELARDRARERRDDDAQTESASDIAAFFRTKHDTEEQK